MLPTPPKPPKAEKLMASPIVVHNIKVDNYKMWYNVLWPKYDTEGLLLLLYAVKK